MIKHRKMIGLPIGLSENYRINNLTDIPSIFSQGIRILIIVREGNTRLIKQYKNIPVAVSTRCSTRTRPEEICLCLWVNVMQQQPDI